MNNFLRHGLLALMAGLLCHTDVWAKTPVPKTPVPLGLEEALYLALENNLSVQLKSLEPLRLRLEERIARADFDPVVSAELSREGGEVQGRTSGRVSVKRRLSTGLSVQVSLVASSPPAGRKTGLELGSSVGVTLPLKKGAGKAVNLVRVHQAQVATAASQEEVRGVALSVASQVLQGYLRVVLAEKKLAIYEESLAVARHQLKQADFLIEVGKLAGVERVAAQAELAGREEALLGAQGEVSRSKLLLARLMNQTTQSDWGKSLQLSPDLPDTTGRLHTLADYLQSAKTRRPDLKQARVELNRRDLEVVKTNDGLLPRLDVFATLSRQERVSNLFETADPLAPLGSGYAMGVQMEWPHGQNAAKAGHARAMLSLKEGRLAIRNLEQQAEEEVRQAYLDVELARSQQQAVSATRRQQQAKASAEAAKFKAGASTPLLVAQTQRDLLASQISEAETLVGFYRALGVLLLRDGSLLQAYGLSVTARD